ncbi:NAD(P)H-dependent glycerol-3-phosphate dehydrogenase [Brachybacterium phenoliresistens]|uniref:Glycerol-3-phosphate dehydrogenase [NAD(P)+] n=1 Tax=Brachybacterium phenoliresistens TaxID=396014 RepID=Z9JXK7_9MICO|nr:NAD(P)H-dependent glycerol-3-phosphate dehydrogenase [Brachybacterium phenoliresistens]EWS82507.1 glycerol-3-phosphate acyltransferase [Brachybacterium phenoliresistens]
MTAFAILGAGSWGCTFALLLARAGHEVTLWARREELAREIREEHRCRDYLGARELPAGIGASSDIAEATQGASALVVAVPAQRLRESLRAWRSAPGMDGALPAVPVVSLAKGIERGSDLRMSEVLVEAGGIDPSQVTVLSGPNLAAEIAEGQPCGSVVAGHDEAVAQQVARWCQGPSLRTYTSSDVIGVEVAGAVKNIVAIAVGAAAGLGYGDNTRASLITRGLAEMSRLGVALGGEAATFAGLAGMGDLVATCASPLSRNHSLGAALGRGLDVQAAAAEVGRTAEGVETARAVAALAQRLGVDMPITRAVVEVVDHRARIEDVTAALLARPVRPE